MKHQHNSTHLKIVEPRYPNAADNQYFARKALDILTGAVSVMGFISAMFFLAAVC